MNGSLLTEDVKDYLLAAVILVMSVGAAVEAAESGATVSSEVAHPLKYVDTAFENASPLWWEIDSDGQVHVHLTYDQERSAPNRANGHFLFRLEADPGSELTLVLGPFANIWNGKLSRPEPEAKVVFISDDGRDWRPLETEPAEPYHVRLRVRLIGESLYVARLEPYRLSDLDRLKREIRGHPWVEISEIGKTVEGRELEMIRIGRPEAPYRVLLRARAHPWEPGGNWVLEGWIRRLLRDDADARRFRQRYCLYVQPLANKDGVARGWTRFNVRGMDLNRQWDRPADPRLAPERAALEAWLETSIAKGQRPNLAIDFHNDASGRLHISRPDLEPAELERYLVRMKRLEALLRKHTWFTEGSTKSSFRNPGTIGEGLLARYGVPALIHELNANWIAGLNDYPTAAHWQRYGEQLAEVCWHYFGDTEE